MSRILILPFLFLATMAFGQRSLNMTVHSNLYPSNLTFGFDEELNDIWGYVDSAGREYAIFGSRQGTHFVDVTDPVNPVEVDFEPANGISSNSFWRDFKTWKHYAFGVADVTSNNTLQIFDLQYLPDSVVKIYDNDEFSSNAHNIHVNNDRLYLISNRRGGVRYPIDILCIEDPHNPVLLGGIRNGANGLGNYSTAHDAFIRNDTVFLSVYFNSFNNNGLHVFDCVDPENVQLIGSIQNYPSPGINHASWMSSDGTHLIMSDETGGSPVKMIDITDLSNMQAVSVFQPDPKSLPHNPFIKDCIAYISYYEEGVQIYDVSNPANPVQTGYFYTDSIFVGSNYNNPSFKGCWGVYPYLPSGNIIATDRKFGLYVMSYTGPTPTCSGDFDRVVEEDTSRSCLDTTTTVSLQPALDLDIAVYPNPTEGVFNIQSNGSDIMEFVVYDIRGVIVKSEVVETNSQTIMVDLSDKEDGMYLLEIRHSQGDKRLKIFKE